MEILFQDSSIVVVNKPSGLLTIQDGYHPEFETVKNKLDLFFNRVWTVHRLDKDTSGVLVFALNPSSHKYLSNQFTNRLIQKEYLAIVHGIINNSEFIINLPLRINGDRKHRTVVDKIHGKPATTLITVIKHSQNATLLKVFPKTGFTHQIRSHLAAINHPIVGDNLYSDMKFLERLTLPRLALHSYRITFSHPLTKQMMTFSAPIPEIFSTFES